MAALVSHVAALVGYMAALMSHDSHDESYGSPGRLFGSAGGLVGSPCELFGSSGEPYGSPVEPCGSAGGLFGRPGSQVAPFEAAGMVCSGAVMYRLCMSHSAYRMELPSMSEHRRQHSDVCKLQQCMAALKSHV